MSRLKFGLIAGALFGLIDILPMIFMEFPDKMVAISGAFASRFAIGFLIPQTKLPFPGWINGLIVGLLISIPDALVTGKFGPIFGSGAIGGVLIGYLAGKKDS